MTDTATAPIADLLWKAVVEARASLAILSPDAPRDVLAAANRRVEIAWNEYDSHMEFTHGANWKGSRTMTTDADTLRDAHTARLWQSVKDRRDELLAPLGNVNARDAIAIRHRQCAAAEAAWSAYINHIRAAHGADRISPP